MKSIGNCFCLGLGVLSLLPACSGSADGDLPDAASIASESAPVLVHYNGRTFKRRDAWSDANYARILAEGRPDLPSTTPEVLAAQLRAHSIFKERYYIELEPNLALANEILAGKTPAPTAEQAPREGRTVIGTDDRTLWFSAASFPATAVGFNNSRGSGVKIGLHTVFTAAHVVFETVATPNGWFCANESISVNGACSAGFPSWRFGVNGTTGYTDWIPGPCYLESISNAYVAWVNGSGSDWDRTRWDYAVIDTRACNDGNTSWFGTSTVDDATLLSMTGDSFGYAERAKCPAGSIGLEGKVNSDGSTAIASDCPGTGSWPGSTWQLVGLPNSAPYTGAKLWFGSTTNVSAGDQDSANTIKAFVDITGGDSGGPLYEQLSNGNRYVVGVSSGQTSTFNSYARWTVETYNFFKANSTFAQ